MFRQSFACQEALMYGGLYRISIPVTTDLSIEKQPTEFDESTYPGSNCRFGKLSDGRSRNAGLRIEVWKELDCREMRGMAS